MTRRRKSSQRGSAANPQGGVLRRAADPRWRRLPAARRREVRGIRAEAPPILRLAALALALAVVFAAVLVLVARSPEEIGRAADGAGAWAPVAFVALCVGLTLAFFPFPLVAAAGGVLFGTLEGTLLSILGAGIGALLAFLVARHAAGEAVRPLVGERLRRLLEAVERRGFVAVLYARIIPGVPRDLANYAFGLTRVAAGAFLAATVLGIAPRAFAYSALGGSLGHLDSTESVVAIATLVAIGVLGLVLARRGVRGLHPG
jgi:uncharacterized membrane protein YdjX (TVP38/TMEM64 family)